MLNDRSLLGPADVSDADLAAMLADLWGHDASEVEVVESGAAEVDYDLVTITTGGRFWVTGRASTPAGPRPFRIFVKQVQSFARSPLFESVPTEVRELAAGTTPWRSEPLAYRSDLHDRLPVGLTMARALAVNDLDELSVALWLEAIDTPPVAWDSARYERAAYLMGRVAASDRVSRTPLLSEQVFTARTYEQGRLRHQVVPILMSDEVFAHPTIAGGFDQALRDRLRGCLGQLDELVDELGAVPLANAHGDASPNNLLPGPRPHEFVLIDFGFWHRGPVGFDLAQLVVGEAQLGRLSVASLPALDTACTGAYAAGLAAEGWSFSRRDLERAHALQMMLYTGMSALPFELLDRPASHDTMTVSRDRAAIVAYCLDRLEATSA